LAPPTGVSVPVASLPVVVVAPVLFAVGPVVPGPLVALLLQGTVAELGSFAG
jgi:hypothetical protein